MTDRSLSHLDPFGGTRMVDVSPKEATLRRALARCRVAMKPETTAQVANNAITKGDVLAAARVAGIQAAKRTADLVPMCHPLLVGSVQVDFTIGDDYVEVEAKVETVDRTGVEMEAMTACAIAALTVYDMCKTADRTMSIGQLMLWEKTGGSSGMWKREPDDSEPGRRSGDRRVTQLRTAERRSWSDSSDVASPPHWVQCSTWRQLRSRRVPSRFSSTTNDSDSGSISTP